jgi:SARP family transcriptional regulator, regulator of embCAB operon
MEYRILGPVEARTNGREVSLDGEKQRTVLAALLIARNGVLSDARLSDLLWGQRPPATLNAQIYTYVSRLRKSLGPGVNITRRAPGYTLHIGSAWFDLAEFEHQVRSGRAALVSGSYAESVRLLGAALALWRGPALANVTEHLAAEEGPRLEEAMINALEWRIEADLALGRHTRVLSELTRLVHEHPLHERFRAQLMTALYRCDRQAEALDLYNDGRRLFAEELGIDPGEMLREVHQAILTADPWLRVPNPQRVPVGSLAHNGSGHRR